VPYFSGRGGVTPPGGNVSPPGSDPNLDGDNDITTGFQPDLVKSEDRVTFAFLVKL